MSQPITGTIRGQTIVLDEVLDLPNGQRVAITLEPLPAAPLSNADRAILEEVYRERGCSVERDS